MNIQNNFLKGRMNKSLDERLLPPGEYRDALNIEVSSVEGTNVGAVKNVQGNSQLTTLEYDGQPLLQDTVCIGAVSNDSKGVMYWFVHAPTSGVDMIVSYNEKVDALTYHVVSVSVLNFSPQYLITGVNIIDDLLIWTDNYNQPRKINVNREYPRPFLGSDVITEADIALIQAPPVSAPTVVMKTVGNSQDYCVDRFISFAYRYKYLDGEYSAMSQFSDAAFIPGGFNLNEDLYVNDGMSNIYNAADVSFNAGDSNVVAIDLCFKINDSNVINVIEKFDKEEQGWVDNSTQTIEFGAKKIYTTLPESELLRVYDNVPRMAKAQTIMGNRIMFGNYVDGFNIVDSSGQPIELNYTLEAITQEVPNENDIASSLDFDSSLYDPAFVQPPVGPFDNVVTVDFTGVTIEQNDSLVIEFELEGVECYNGSGASVPAVVNGRPFSFSKAIRIDANYANAAALAASTSFIDNIGTISNIQPIVSACSGTTLSDIFGCAATSPILTGGSYPFPPNLINITRLGYGFSAVGQPIEIPSTTVNSIDLAIPVMKFLVEVVGAPDVYLYQYYKINSVKISYIKYHGNQSLHSNRGYEVGIIYMDEFGRNSTTLICDTNSLFLPPTSSVTRNVIRAYINHLPPAWATRYKFSIKQSKGDYNIVYSNRNYSSAALGTWFKLDGQNQLIPAVGSKLIVKVDANGPLTTSVMVEVLDVQSQPTGFIASAPAGLYMEINYSSFAVTSNADLIVFETDPSEVNDKIYYEGSQSFSIINGYHQGNLTNQGAVQPAISDLSFFNCYTFGNGVEGYKALDGIVARSLVMGNRFSAVADEDYRETRRFSSITYSGVYGEQTNVNKLNEFNLALANYKDLEKIFGSIQILFGRQTDVLALQEDKISYVLAGKNLLSDAAAGGSITSVPEVLGTQMARLEDYGIGLNPESFASFGYEKYFTDAKRGALLRLMGSSYSNDQLEVISEYGMGSWFRDRFIETTDKQKLGVYDPFMDQYILAIKDDAVESPEIVLACGSFIDSAVATEPMVFYIDAGTQTGNIQLVYTIGLIAGSINFRATFNGVQVASGPVTNSGFLNVNKTTAYPNRVMVEVIPIAGGGNFELQINCP
jgi:hypothetical protein